jgi:hypothetical protein
MTLIEASKVSVALALSAIQSILSICIILVAWDCILIDSLYM